jgi:hypothetical protein
MLVAGEAGLAEVEDYLVVVVVEEETCWVEEETVEWEMLWVKAGAHWTMGG